ncbi:MAG: response regulator transcription factor [Steroidobacteraceae bacterium]
MRMLVVEDDAAIAESLRRALQRTGTMVDVSRDGKTALAQIGGWSYDCIILDLGLPDMDGMEVLRRIRRDHDHTPVLIVTARDETADKVSGLDLGADDYVPKPFELSELEARIRAVTRRAIARRGDDVTAGRLRLSMVESRVFLDEAPLDLSPREFAVLECLLLRLGRVVSKRQLLDLFSDWDAEPSENAAELYVHRVRKKIDGSGCNIRTLRGFGYLLQVDGGAGH